MKTGLSKEGSWLLTTAAEASVTFVIWTVLTSLLNPIGSGKDIPISYSLLPSIDTVSVAALALVISGSISLRIYLQRKSTAKVVQSLSEGTPSGNSRDSEAVVYKNLHDETSLDIRIRIKKTKKTRKS